MKALMTSVALLAATLAAPAGASSDGVLGSTSSGTFTVTATVSEAAPGDQVQVFGLDDFSLSWSFGGVGAAENHSFCIIRSTPEGLGGPVSITISSFDAADTAFLVKTAGGADEVELNINILNNNDLIGYPMVEGTPFPSIPVSGVCTDGPEEPTALVLQVATDQGAGAPQGIYSGSFLITVAPD